MGKQIIGSNVILGDDVRLGDGVEVGSNVILEGDITVGSGTRIDHGCIVRGRVTIGRNNWIYPYGVIGTGPQHKDFADRIPPGSPSDAGEISIGDGNTIREFATIHRPTISERTAVGSNCYIMAYPHIGHDCMIEDGVIMATRVTLGGHVRIGRYANIGQGTKVHPYCKTGSYAMIGMGSSITKDVLPFALMNRQRFTKINRVGMERNGVTRDDINGIDDLYRKGFPVQNPSRWYESEVASFVAESTRRYYPPSFEE